MNDDGPRQPNLSVLVVDDDEAIRRSVQRILTLDGYHVNVATSGRELISRDDLDEHFAILLDRKLPDGDSSQFIEELRRRAPHASVVIITGYADMASTLAAIRSGVNDYLIKPVEPEALRSRLRSLAELYQMRHELRASESRMRFLVENLPAGAIFVDRETLFINRAVERLTGYQTGEINTVGDWFRVLCADRSQECQAKYHEMQLLDFKQACVLPIVRKDGVRRELSIAAHRYEQQEVWLVTDVTELQDAERRLVQSERLAAIGQMVTGLAHESRNALQRARGCLDLLELDLENQPEQLNLISRIRRALGDLQRNYEEVRQYAAPICLEKSRLDLGDTIQTAFDDLRAEYGLPRLQLSIHRDGAPEVKADAHRLGQVFRNVLENAIAASDAQARIEARLSVPVDEHAPAVQCEITDYGSGMDKESVTRVFEPFYTTKQSGTGLGMAICRRIIEAHGGHIMATSQPGEGTTIIIRLPQ